MAYNTKSGISILGGFKPRSAQPLDVRTKVATIAERDELVTAHVAYPGLRVWVDEEAKTYEYNGSTWNATVTGTAYTHPDTHPATMIEDDETHRFVTDDEKAAWNAKASTDVVTTEKDGLMSAADKTKFDEMSTGFADKVDKTTTVNGHALDKDISLTADDVGAIPATQKGSANGVAELDANGKVPAAQLPGFVDDVVDVFMVSGKVYLAVDGSVVDVANTEEVTPEDGKIYVDIETNKEYRWSGTTYVRLNDGVALGETSTTAYRGDYGKIAYDHSQAPHAPADAQKNVQSDWNQSDTAADDFIKNKPESLPADGGDADTVGGHTVGTDVPENAVFTDTTYEVFNDTKDGLVPKTGELTSGKYRFLADNGVWKTINISIAKVEATEGNPVSNDLYVKIQDEDGNDITKALIPTVSSNGYGLMTPEMMIKLQGIEEGATAYTHPDTHPATMITTDESHRFATDTQINEWNAKASKDTATIEANGLMSAEDKAKLDSIGEGATAYEHPDTHPATMIVEDDEHKFVTVDEKTKWNSKANIYSGETIEAAPATAPKNSLYLKILSADNGGQEGP